MTIANSLACAMLISLIFCIEGLIPGHEGLLGGNNGPIPGELGIRGPGAVGPSPEFTDNVGPMVSNDGLAPSPEEVIIESPNQFRRTVKHDRKASKREDTVIDGEEIFPTTTVTITDDNHGMMMYKKPFMVPDDGYGPMNPGIGPMNSGTMNHPRLGMGYGSGPGMGYGSGPGTGYGSGPGMGYGSGPGMRYGSGPGLGYHQHRNRMLIPGPF
jgi:hypothetical protein